VPRSTAVDVATYDAIVTAPRSGTEVVLAWEPPSFSIPGSADALS